MELCECGSLLSTGGFVDTILCWLDRQEVSAQSLSERGLAFETRDNCYCLPEAIIIKLFLGSFYKFNLKRGQQWGPVSHVSLFLQKRLSWMGAASRRLCLFGFLGSRLHRGAQVTGHKARVTSDPCTTSDQDCVGFPCRVVWVIVTQWRTYERS